MTPPPSNPSQDRFARSKSVFLAVLDQPEHQRPTALDQLCAGDTALRDEVARLLAQHATDSPLDRPPPVFQTHATITPDSEPDTPPVHPGQTLGPYTIHAHLGAGGMGVVYEAAHRVTNQPVALKLIRPDAATPRTRRRFEAEGRALARLRHPGIAQVHDAGLARPDNDPNAPAIPYIAMELVRGRPITAAAADLPREDRLRLIEQTARAVHHAHLNGVVHRDLKPANVLVDDQNRVKVLDFGIAKLTEHDESAPAVTTHAGQIIGTPAYMAPEQLGADPRDGGGGGGGVDHRADVYALGVILFEVLTGRRPIETDTASDLWSVLRRVEQGPPALASIDRTCRGDLDVITAVALRADPAERYQSAAELADDLARHLEARPILARPRTRRYIVGRFIKRNPWPVALGAAAAIAIAAGTTGIVFKQQQAAAAERRATQRFNETRELARAVLFDVEDAIARLPGATRARHLLIQTSQGYLDRLAADPSADDELRLEIAEGYTKLAEILGTPYMHNIGNRDEALRNMEAAIALLEPMLTPDAPARVYFALGRVLLIRNSTTAGTEREVIRVNAARMTQLLNTAAAMQPDDPSIHAYRIRALRSQAMIDRQADDAGIDRLIGVLKIAEQTFSLWPTDEPLAQEYAELCYWIGLTIVEAGKEGASHYLAEGERVLHSLLAQDPANVLARQRLASIWSVQARKASARGDARQTADMTHAVFDTWDRLAATDPDSQFISRGRFVARMHAGDHFAALTQSDPDHTLEHYRTALELFREGDRLLQHHIDRGWLWPWESQYPEIVRVRIQATETNLRRFEEAAEQDRTKAPDSVP